MDYAELMQGLSDRTRLRIMALLALMQRELCVCQIVFALGESQYKVSRHLRILRHCGWLQERKAGRWVHYSLGPLCNDAFGAQIMIALTAFPAAYLALRGSLVEIGQFSPDKPCEV